MNQQKSTGELIREARKKIGISQSELALTVGVKKSAVCRWERGHRSPSPEKLIRIAIAIGVCPAELLPINADAKSFHSGNFSVDDGPQSGI